MGAEAQAVKVRPEHVLELARTMRPEDAAEVLAAGHATPFLAIEASLGASTSAWALLLGGELAAIFGIVEEAPHGLLLGPGRGIPWALTSTAVPKHRKAFLRASRAAAGLFLRRCPELHQFIDARYAAALRWVRRLGFEVLPAEPFGPHALPFHHVILRRPGHV